jgi:hypothetical protein
MARSLWLEDPQKKLPRLVTPCLIVPTEMGLIPHVTPDIAPLAPLYFAAGDFLDHSLPPHGSLPSSLGLGLRWSFLGLSSDFNNFDEGPSRSGIKVFTRNGSPHVVTPPIFRALVDQFRPQGVIAPHCRILPGASARQRDRRARVSASLCEVYTESVTFAVADAGRPDLALFFECGRFGPAEAAAARAQISARPPALPRLILFDGHPEEVRAAVGEGFDLFVLKLPVYCAEKGVAVTFGFREVGDELGICLRDVEFAGQHTPIVAGCDCTCCAKQTRSYVHHLVNVHELLEGTLLVQHNVTHFQRFMEFLCQEGR